MINCNTDFINNLNTTKKTKVIDVSGKSFIDKYGNDYNMLASEVNSNNERVYAYRNWYILSDGYYYFKDQQLFAELLMSELAKEFKIKCVDFLIAVNSGKFGIISKNYRNGNSNYYDASEIFLKHKLSEFYNSIFNQFSLISNSFVNADYVNTYNTLSRMLAFDFFSGQRDRGYYNLFFRNDDDSLEVSPLTDNGAIFKDYSLNAMSSVICDITFPEEKTVTPEEYYSLQLIINNEEFRNYLLLCLDIDIDSIIKRTLDKYKLSLFNDEKRQIVDYFDRKKCIIDKTLSLIKKS